MGRTRRPTAAETNAISLCQQGGAWLPVLTAVAGPVSDCLVCATLPDSKPVPDEARRTASEAFETPALRIVNIGTKSASDLPSERLTVILFLIAGLVVGHYVLAAPVSATLLWRISGAARIKPAKNKRVSWHRLALAVLPATERCGLSRGTLYGLGVVRDCRAAFGRKNAPHE
jgi:hypothetical protein